MRNLTTTKKSKNEFRDEREEREHAEQENKGIPDNRRKKNTTVKKCLATIVNIYKDISTRTN